MAGLIIGSASVRANKVNSTEIKHLFSPIDYDVRKYLINERSSEELNNYAKYLVRKYSKRLDVIIDKLERITEKNLTQKEKEKIKYLLIREYLSKIDQEQQFNRYINISKEMVKLIPIGIYKDSKYIYKIYYAPLSSNVPYPIYYWIQVYPDVYGGKGIDDSGNNYNVNGGNNLYQISVEYTTNYVKYTLYFKDEDHPDPTWDAIYDAWRQILYGRIEDIESFTVKDGIIFFDDIWDNNKTYAEWWGQFVDLRIWSDLEIMEIFKILENFVY